MTKVFLNYRSADEGFGVHLLDRELSERFGSDQVFFASKSIPVGAAWEEAMTAAVATSDALLAIMGRHWLAATADDGTRLIDQADDFVRREILLARKLAKQIIPVRLGIPRIKADQLPSELSWLPGCQDVEVRFRSARADIDQLASKLRTLLPQLDRKLGVTTQPAARTYINNGAINNLWQVENSTMVGPFNLGSTVHYHGRDVEVDG